MAGRGAGPRGTCEEEMTPWDTVWKVRKGLEKTIRAERQRLGVLVRERELLG